MGRVALAFLLGHCCIHCLPRLPPGHWPLGLASACSSRLSLLGCVGRFKPLARARELRRGAGLGAACNAVGRSAGDLPPALEGQDLLVRGYVASVPQRRGRRFAIRARCRRAARRRLAADPPRRGIERRSAPQRRRAVAARRATQAAQRFCESRRRRTTKRSCFAKASARPAMSATTRATPGSRRRPCATQ